MFLEAAAHARAAAEPRLQRRRAGRPFLYQVTHKNGERCSAAKAYLTPNLSRPNLKVLTHARVVAHPARRQARGRRRRTAGRRDRAGARAPRSHRLRGRVRLAAAAAAVGHRPGRASCSALGIPVVHDLPGVGKNLQDHIDYVQTWRTRSDTETFGCLAARHGQAGAARCFEWRKQRTGMITSHLRRVRRLPALAPGRAGARPAAGVRHRHRRRPRAQAAPRPRLLLPRRRAAPAQPRRGRAAQPRPARRAADRPALPRRRARPAAAGQGRADAAAHHRVGAASTPCAARCSTRSRADDAAAHRRRHPQPRRHPVPPGRHLQDGAGERSDGGASTRVCACAASTACASSTPRSCRR